MTQLHSFLFLAPGFEEIEALATVDVLRRAGMAVSTVAVNGGSKFIKGAKGVTVEADILAEDADFSAAEWLICPGGMPGATNLANSPVVSAALTTHFKRGGKIAAICASPAVVLEPLGILQGREATCYPGMKKMISSAKTKDAPVVISGNVITGNGPASTILFALAIVKSSKGKEVAGEVGSGLLFYPNTPEFYF